GPFLLRNKVHQVLLDFFCRRFSSHSEPPGKAAHVGIDDYANVNVESIAENDIGSLPTHAAETRQFVHGSWDLTGMFINQSLARGFDTLRFIAEEPGRFDFLFEFGKRRVSVIGSRAVFLK